MKIKYSVIPFVPVAVIMIVFKLMSVVGLDNNGMFLGMNKIGVNFAVIGMAIGLFVLCVIINLFDRKTAPVYPVKKNPVAGAAAVASGLLVITSTVLSLIDMSPSSEYFLMMIICTVLSILMNRADADVQGAFCRQEHGFGCFNVVCVPVAVGLRVACAGISFGNQGLYLFV